MKVCVLSSGSKGNCTYVETNNHKILIDIGTSCLYIEKSLKKINVLPQEIDIILITHSHVDHIAGLKVFLKKYHPKVYLTPIIQEEIGIPIENVEYIDNNIKIDTTLITAIKTSHDTKDSNGYIIEEDNSSVVYIIDTGYINEKFFKVLYNKTVYVFESNHDLELLMNNPHYPHHIKIRIMSDKGHLSNKDSAYYLSNFIGKNTKKVILAHLSEENNNPGLALTNLQTTLQKKNISFNDIIIAQQNIQTELYEI